MAASTFLLRVWYPGFSREPSAARVVRDAAGRHRNLMMRTIAKTVRQTSPRRSGQLRRRIRYRSVQNRNGLAVSRLTVGKFYSSFVDDRTRWFSDATDENAIIALINPLLGQWEATLRAAIERAAQRVLKRAESEVIKVRFGR